MSDETTEAAVRAAQRAGREEDVAVRLCPVAYVVTQGSYSDYRIRGVFLDKARARAHADKCSKPDEDGYAREAADVEEWPLANLDGSLDCGAFTGYLNQDGLASHFTWEHSARVGAPFVSVRRGTGQWNGHVFVTFNGSGATEEHARRSAEQLRREWLAAGYTPESYMQVVESGGPFTGAATQGGTQ